MKVAILSSFPKKKCGIAYFTKLLVDNLRRKNEVEKIVVIGDEESSDANYRLNFRSAFLYRGVNKILQREEIDVLYIWHEYWLYGPLNLGFINTLIATRVPIVTKLASLSSTDPGVPLWERIRATFVEKIVSLKSEKIVVDPGVASDQIKKFPRKKIATISLGIVPKEKKHIISDKKVILFFGVISPHKGVDNLVRASKHLNGVRIVIAGKPDMNTDRLLELVRENSKYNEIRLDLDWIPDDKKEIYFREADVVVLPYTRIGLQSGVLYDALCYGIPCVVSREGMMGSIVSKYRIGVLVSPTDPFSIAEGIKKVLNQYSIYQNNIIKYQQIASWEHVVEELILVFKEAIDEDRR